MTDSKRNYWVKCISTEGNLRGVAVQATDLVRELAETHKTRGILSQGLGEALVGGILLGSYCKTDQRINLNIRGSGLWQQALVDAYPDGRVRGYVIEREQLLDSDATLGPWGDGLLSVLRTHDAEGEQPYIGTVPLLTGHLAKDLSFYWLQSEQTPSVVGLFVHLDGEKIVAAHGFLVQALPGATPEEIQHIENHLKQMQTLLAGAPEELTPMKLLASIFQSTAFVVLEEKPVTFSCHCSWERVERALSLLGEAELKSMAQEDHSASIHCEFCRKHYLVDETKLLGLISKTH